MASSDKPCKRPTSRYSGREKRNPSTAARMSSAFISVIGRPLGAEWPDKSRRWSQRHAHRRSTASQQAAVAALLEPVRGSGGGTVGSEL